MKHIYTTKVLCGTPSEAEYDIFNQRKKWISQTLESNSISFLILIRKILLLLPEKHRHFCKVYTVKQDEIVYYASLTISIR